MPFFEDLERGVSWPRLARYRSANGTDLETAVNSFWNIGLSEALYPGFAALEITLRTSIHQALTDREQTDMWFRSLLEPNQLKAFADAYVVLYNRHRRTAPVASQVVAELTFGFWTTLLS